MHFPRIFLNARNIEDIIFTESDKIDPRTEEEFLRITSRAVCVFMDIPSPRFLKWLHNKSVKTDLPLYHEKEEKTLNEDGYDWYELKQAILYYLFTKCEKIVLSYKNSLLEELGIGQRIALYSCLEKLLTLKNQERFVVYDESQFSNHKEAIGNCVMRILNLLLHVTVSLD